MKNCGFTYPGKSIIINIAPANIRKEGSAYDLAIAIGVMAAGSFISSDLLDEIIIIIELSLDLSILLVKCKLPIKKLAEL
jgi:magnesium chelatase family protein